MNGYDNRRITLDPGLTALTLRGLHEREGHYPFLDRLVRRRRSPRRAVPAGPARGTRAVVVRPPASFWSRHFPATCAIVEYLRPRAERRSSSVAA